MSYIPPNDPRILSAIESVRMNAEVGTLYSRSPWSAWKACAKETLADMGLPTSDSLAGMVASRARLAWLGNVQSCQQELSA